MREPPRAAVEHHHHIQALMDQQDRNSRDRQAHRDREAVRAERAKEIASSKAQDTIAFWCQRCRLDILAQSILEVERDWEDPSQDVAFYRTKCFRGHWLIRLAMDKWRDAYWSRSRRCLADVGAHGADIIQPHETGFNLLYGNKQNKQ